MSKLSHQELGTLRDEGTQILGKNIIFHGLSIPGNSKSEIEDVVLNTHDGILIASQVEVYPYLQPETLYKKRFDDGDRGADEIFAFQTRGLPHMSIVLPNQPDAIAVIKKYIDQRGDEVALAAALEELGLDRSHFKAFVDIVDGIDTTRRNAQVQLRAVEGLEDISCTLTEHPKPEIANLDSALHLDRATRANLRELLSSRTGAASPNTIRIQGA